MKKTLASFRYAFNGMFHFFRHERNARIHAVCALISILLAVFFQFSTYEWLFLILIISAVLATEMINSAIEHLCDVVSPDQHPGIKSAKDLAAAGVLFTAIAALIAEAFLFIPHFLEFFSS